MANRIMLDVCYNFSLKELGITFHTAQQAQQYQERNREARILAEEKYVVWIPIPDDMTQIRASSFGFVMCFKSADGASRWCERVVLGVLYDAQGRYKNEAYIVREWSTNELNRKLAGKEKQLEVPDRIVSRGPSPGRIAKAAERVEGGKNKDPVGFGVPPAQGSRHDGVVARGYALT